MSVVPETFRSFRDGAISAFDALWRRARNPDKDSVIVSGFRVRAFSAPRNDKLACQAEA
jgi:hypothetical protein